MRGSGSDKSKRRKIFRVYPLLLRDGLTLNRVSVRGEEWHERKCWLGQHQTPVYISAKEYAQGYGGATQPKMLIVARAKAAESFWGWCDGMLWWNSFVLKYLVIVVICKELTQNSQLCILFSWMCTLLCTGCSSSNSRSSRAQYYSQPDSFKQRMQPDYNFKLVFNVKRRCSKYSVFSAEKVAV